MAINYAAVKLGAACSGAMRSEQALHLRLAGCVTEIAALIHHDHLPPDLLQRLTEITSTCMRVTDPELGAPIATAQRMDRQEITLWLGKIHDLYEAVLKREEREKMAREIMAVRP